MNDLACEDVRAEAAELALGILPGARRAACLEHLEHCPACRRLVDELAQTADSLLVLAPRAEPSAGFEERVLAALPPRPRQGPVGRRPDSTERAARRHHRQRRRSSRRPARLVAGAALAVAVVVGGTLGGQAALGGGPSGGDAYQGTVAALGAQGFLSGRLVSHGGRVVGQALVYRGSPGWVFMTVAGRPRASTYVCRLSVGGSSMTVGRFHPTGRQSRWASPVRLPAGKVRTIELVTPAGATVASATLARPS